MGSRPAVSPGEPRCNRGARRPGQGRFTCPRTTCALALIIVTGRRVSQQDLRRPLLAASRRILHPPNDPTFQSRLVHVKGVGMRALHQSLPEGFTTYPATTPSAIWAARPRRDPHGAPPSRHQPLKVREGDASFDCCGGNDTHVSTSCAGRPGQRAPVDS